MVELTVGQRITLDAHKLIQGVEDSSINFNWASSNVGVATVSSPGRTSNVTAIAAGTATITATETGGTGMSGTCPVTVVTVASRSVITVVPRPS